MTRDGLLPILAPLAAARAAGVPLADLVAGLPARFTAADRLTGIPTERSQALIARLAASVEARAAFFDTPSAEAALDLTDGLRVIFGDGAIVHLRPSGNAPECRCYAEADSPDEASALVTRHLGRMRDALT
jgi:phosphomannomutase